MSTFLFHTATPTRCLSVSLSEDATVVAVGMVGDSIDFAEGKSLPPGYWEFEGEQAEQIVEAVRGWDALGVFTLVWYWQFSGTLPVDLPDVEEFDTQDTQSGPVAVHASPQQTLRGAV
ncbi:hypothetical protein [Armatimonas sp.]|uniref:hypothetical protein n=1 Tax=Armatimonas sp. TaxID=1872638 RepID=UPI0037531261